MIMPQMDGFTAMQHSRERHPDIRVIALTSFLEGEFVQRAIQAAPAAIYWLMCKPTNWRMRFARLARASTLAPEATQALIHAMAQPAQLAEPLSEREREVLGAYGQGLSNGEIAAQC